MDTGVCAASVRKFNKLAAGMENTLVLAISKDLPFAQGRFCTAEGIEHVIPLSDFRYTSTFGKDYGVLMTDGPLCGLLLAPWLSSIRKERLSTPSWFRKS